MPLSTVRGQFPYPVAGDPDNVPVDLQALAVRLGVVGALYAQGTAAARGAAGTAGKFYLATDTGVVSYDTGSAWIDLLSTTAASAAYAYSGSVAFLAADQVIPNGTLTAIPLSSEEHDTADWHSTVTNPSRMTVPSGVTRVDIEAQIGFLPGSGRRSLFIRKNAVTVAVVNQNAVAGDSSYLHSGKKDVPVVPGDYLEMLGFQDSGGALTVQGGSGLTWLAVRKVA